MFSFFRKSVAERKEPIVTEVVNDTGRSRVSAGQRAAHQRFAAAKSSRLHKSRLGAGLSIDEVLRRDAANIRAASRSAGEDVGYVKRYFGMVQTHVVGDKGFRLQSEARMASGKLDKKAAQAIEAAWKDFNRLGVCEISGRMSGISADQLIAKSVCQDGDVLIRHIDGAPNKYGYAFQIIEADRLDVHLTKPLNNGSRIKMGVEIDGYGRHIAYHVLTDHPGDYTWSHGHKKYIRIPADEIILPFPMWRPGQTRGVPWAHASLLDMHDIAGFRESTLVGARVGAANMVIYERDPELDVIDEEWNESGEFISELEPGASTVVPEGYKAKESNFKMPDGGFGEFQKSALRGATAGMEANYNVVGNDYEGVSWSSLRQAILEDREHWKRLQQWYASQVKTPVVERWLRNALLAGAIKGLQAYDLDRCLPHSFMGRRWQWVDPLKDEQAVGEAMGNFTINPMDVLNDKGIDLEAMAEGWDRYLSEMGPLIKSAQGFGFGNQKTTSQQKSKQDEQSQDDNTSDE